MNAIIGSNENNLRPSLDPSFLFQTLQTQSEYPEHFRSSMTADTQTVALNCWDRDYYKYIELCSTATVQAGVFPSQWRKASVILC